MGTTDVIHGTTHDRIAEEMFRTRLGMPGQLALCGVQPEPTLKVSILPDEVECPECFRLLVPVVD